GPAGSSPVLALSDDRSTTKGQAALPALQVVSPGFLTSVQDLGRFGWAHFGISASGAADPLAFRAANLLVGNPDNLPAFEMTLSGGEFVFDQAAVIALCGSDFGGDFPLWTATEIAAGQPVRLSGTRAGGRGYLAVRGGLDVPRVMGSASVHVMTGVGGRPLRKGDEIVIGNAAVRRPRATARAVPVYAGGAALRVTSGPQAALF